jgi:hypothetical protein
VLAHARAHNQDVATITVERQIEDDVKFELKVRVEEGGSSTSHVVTAAREDFERLCREEETPEDFVKRCFEFLLEREPKESVLGRFDISVIKRYFPEFEHEII